MVESVPARIRAELESGGGGDDVRVGAFKATETGAAVIVYGLVWQRRAKPSHIVVVHRSQNLDVSGRQAVGPARDPALEELLMRRGSVAHVEVDVDRKLPSFVHLLSAEMLHLETASGYAAGPEYAMQSHGTGTTE